MKINFLFFLSFIIFSAKVDARICPITEHQIRQLKQSLLCRSEESLRTCQHTTGIGVSAQSIYAGGIAEDVARDTAEEMWKSKVKLCKVPGFSLHWLEFISTPAFATSVECLAQDLYVEKLFDKVHPEVDRVLKQNIEAAKAQKPSFLNDENTFLKSLQSKNPQANETDLKKIIDLSTKTATLTPSDSKELLSLGLSAQQLEEIKKFHKSREQMNKLQELVREHTDLVQKLKEKKSLTAAETKAYTNFVSRIPQLKQSASIGTKLNGMQLAFLAKTTSVIDKANYIASTKDRLMKQALEKGITAVGGKIAGHIIPVVNVYTTAKEGVEVLDAVNNTVIVSELSACSQTFSEYTMLDENCRPIQSKHMGVLAFLSRDWKTQSRALEADPALCENISSIHKELAQPPYKTTCTNKGFVADSVDSVGGMQIRGFRNPNGNLEKLVFEASQLNPNAVDNRTFAMTYKGNEMQELRYLNLKPATALRYNAIRWSTKADSEDNTLREEIGNFRAPEHYKKHLLKELPPESPRGKRAISQVRENNFFITEIMGCCDEDSVLPSVRRCEDYGIQRKPPVQRPAKTGKGTANL